MPDHGKHIEVGACPDSAVAAYAYGRASARIIPSAAVAVMAPSSLPRPQQLNPSQLSREEDMGRQNASLDWKGLHAA